MFTGKLRSKPLSEKVSSMQIPTRKKLGGIGECRVSKWVSTTCLGFFSLVKVRSWSHPGIESPVWAHAGCWIHEGSMAGVCLELQMLLVLSLKAWTMNWYRWDGLRARRKLFIQVWKHWLGAFCEVLLQSSSLRSSSLCSVPSYKQSLQWVFSFCCIYRHFAEFSQRQGLFSEFPDKQTSLLLPIQSLSG